jgi:hypothetical protein
VKRPYAWDLDAAADTISGAMPRIGELLVQAGIISSQQLDDALRAQVLWGGRLGTSIVELTGIDLDVLSTYLAKQRRGTPALRHHFEQSDSALQRRLSRDLAHKWKCVPLAELADGSGRIAVAAVDPLPVAALTEIGGRLGVAPLKLVVGLAAELRVYYFLERVYEIPRLSRHLRVRHTGTQDIPLPSLPQGTDPDFDAGATDVEGPSVDVDIDIDLEVPISPIELNEAAVPQSTFRDETSDRRRYVATLSETVDLDITRQYRNVPVEIDDMLDAGVAELAPPPTVDESDATQVYPAAPPPEPTEALGRISLAKREVLAAVDATDTSPTDLRQALRAIRRAHDRNRVGDLVVETLMKHGDPVLNVGGILVIRNGVAMGWKGERRGMTIAFDAIAIPLSEPSMFSRCSEIAGKFALDRFETSVLDQRLIALFLDDPSYAVIAPALIAEQVVAFIYGHGSGDIDRAFDVATQVAESAQIAFNRLLRAAQR